MAGTEPKGGGRQVAGSGVPLAIAVTQASAVGSKQPSDGAAQAPELHGFGRLVHPSGGGGVGGGGEGGGGEGEGGGGASLQA